MAPGTDSLQLCLRLLLLAPPLSGPSDVSGWVAAASLEGNTTWGVLSTLLGHVRVLAARGRVLEFVVAATNVCCFLALVPSEHPTTDFNPACLGGCAEIGEQTAVVWMQGHNAHGIAVFDTVAAFDTENESALQQCGGGGASRPLQVLLLR